MINSRSIDDLRADIAVNCRVMMQMCKDAGLSILITGTVRDEEYQLQCYNNGYSKAKVPSFHSVKAGLAFDICKNVKGHEYDDLEFFARCAEIGKKIGFEWGGDWKSFLDRPHFQWSGEKHEYTSKMIISGQYPPTMPEYKEDDDKVIRYKKLSDIPNDYGARDIIEKMMNAGVIQGDGSDSSGNDDVIDLSRDMVRMLVINYRAGLYDGKLK